jgi:hypothetical protein
MSGADELRACADSVESACSALTEGAPAALDGCTGVLQSAIERLAALRLRLAEGSATAEVLEEAWQLRRSIRRAGALLENAAAYHRGWSAVLAVKTAGYGPGGAPGDVIPMGRICVEA